MSPFPSQMDAPVLHPELLARGMNSLTELKLQWHNPTDILSFLLLLGPDVIQRAIAQQVGHNITPIAFSFGWVAYSLGALISVFGGDY